MTPIPDGYRPGDAKCWYSGLEPCREYLVCLLQCEHHVQHGLPMVLHGRPDKWYKQVLIGKYEDLFENVDAGAEPPLALDVEMEGPELPAIEDVPSADALMAPSDDDVRPGPHHPLENLEEELWRMMNEEFGEPEAEEEEPEVQAEGPELGPEAEATCPIATT